MYRLQSWAVLGKFLHWGAAVREYPTMLHVVQKLR